tara:strand:- start:1224 stop:1604 length:381 start_codon:yes stop_codon:yes gene_type:complete
VIYYKNKNYNGGVAMTVQDKAFTIDFERIRTVLEGREWQANRITAAIWDYALWLDQIQESPMVHHELSDDGAQVWHCHLMTTGRYQLDMSKIFGFGYRIEHIVYRLEEQSKYYRTCPICTKGGDHF